MISNVTILWSYKDSIGVYFVSDIAISSDVNYNVQRKSMATQFDGEHGLLEYEPLNVKFHSISLLLAA